MWASHDLLVLKYESVLHRQEHKTCISVTILLPWSNAFWPGLTPFGPPMWQAEADTELTLSASPTTAVGQKALALAKRRYSTVQIFYKYKGFWVDSFAVMGFYSFCKHRILWRAFEVICTIVVFLHFLVKRE